MSFIIRMCVFCLTARGDRDLYLYLKKNWNPRRALVSQQGPIEPKNPHDSP